MENIDEFVGKTVAVKVEPTWQERQAFFMNGLRRDSLAAGAIPNPHAHVKIPRVKKLSYVVNRMFLRGLPAGWGK